MKKILIMTLTFALLFGNVVLAGDMLYRFMHNDHDVLIVGTITQIVENKIKADVNNTIVSTEYMNQIDKKIQLNPAKVTIDITDYNLDFELTEGDFILASLNKSLLDYKIANGIYKVDSTDIKTLKIICDDKESKTDIAAIEYFINSNGVVNTFIFENDSVQMIDATGKRVVIYEKEDDGYNDTLIVQSVSTEEAVLAKAYDDAMVVTIILTAGIMAVIILMKFRIKVED